MELSGSELFLILTVVSTGIAVNLLLYFKNAERNKKINWSLKLYGSALLIGISGILTPADVLSNLIFSMPLIIVFIWLINKYFPVNAIKS